MAASRAGVEPASGRGFLLGRLFFSGVNTIVEGLLVLGLSVKVSSATTCLLTSALHLALFAGGHSTSPDSFILQGTIQLPPSWHFCGCDLREFRGRGMLTNGALSGSSNGLPLLPAE